MLHLFYFVHLNNVDDDVDGANFGRANAGLSRKDTMSLLKRSEPTFTEGPPVFEKSEVSTLIGQCCPRWSTVSNTCSPRCNKPDPYQPLSRSEQLTILLLFLLFTTVLSQRDFSHGKFG